MATEPTTDLSERIGTLGLWFGVLGAPAAWTAHLLVSYLLLYLVCGTAWEFLLYAVTVVAVLIAAAAGYVSWRTWQDSRREARPTLLRAAARNGFMGITGLLISALFGFIVLVAGAVPIVLGTCEGGP